MHPSHRAMSTTIAGSNRSASAVKAWRRRQWAHLNTAVFRRTTLASLELRWARPLQLALDALYQSTELALSDTDDLNIQQTGSLQDPSMSQVRIAARTIRSWPHQALLTALEKTCQGCLIGGTSMPPYAYSLRKVVASGGTSWQRLDDPCQPSQARDLHDGWCMLSMVHSNVFPEFLQADWYHVACTCFMPQPQFWNHAWPHGQRCCPNRLDTGVPAQVSCKVCFYTAQPAVRSGCHVSRRAGILASLPCGLHPSTGYNNVKWQQDPDFNSGAHMYLEPARPPVRRSGWPVEAPTNWPQGPMPCWECLIRSACIYRLHSACCLPESCCSLAHCSWSTIHLPAVMSAQALLMGAVPAMLSVMLPKAVGNPAPCLY